MLHTYQVAGLTSCTFSLSLPQQTTTTTFPALGPSLIPFSLSLSVHDRKEVLGRYIERALHAALCLGMVETEALDCLVARGIGAVGGGRGLGEGNWEGVDSHEDEGHELEEEVAGHACRDF